MHTHTHAHTLKPKPWKICLTLKPQTLNTLEPKSQPQNPKALRLKSKTAPNSPKLWSSRGLGGCRGGGKEQGRFRTMDWLSLAPESFGAFFPRV